MATILRNEKICLFSFFFYVARTFGQTEVVGLVQNIGELAVEEELMKTMIKDDRVDSSKDSLKELWAEFGI